jgi:hypothetical protein
LKYLANIGKTWRDVKIKLKIGLDRRDWKSYLRIRNGAGCPFRFIAQGVMGMKARIVLFIGVFLASASQIACAQQIGDVLKGLQKGTGSGSAVSDTEIVNGLKEALQVGTGNAVQVVSKTDGYYKNPRIRIPLPDTVQKTEKILRAAGYGSKVDEFELSMNRAAERAAPEAKNLFVDAIKQMIFTDAKKILNGRENEATLYFKDRTSARLKEIAKPIVHKSMGEVGATKFYQDLEQSARSVPFAGAFAFDLDQYVTDEALEGLFLMVAEEEKKIRQDPVARTTDLLKKVFGSR